MIFLTKDAFYFSVLWRRHSNIKTNSIMLKSKLLKMLLVFFVLGTTSSEAQIFKKKKKKTEKTAPGKPKKGAIQPYNKVITKKAKTDKGLVSRISKTASGIGFGGGKINTQVLRWEKKSKKVLLRVVSHSVVAADSLPVHEAVVNSNFEPVLYSFDIKALKKDSLNPATVIQVEEDSK